MHRACSEARKSPFTRLRRAWASRNLTQFYRRFHEYAGMTPQEYRTSPLR